MKNKKGVVVIKDKNFKVFYQPFVYASGLYYGNGRRHSAKKKHTIEGRRQGAKMRKIRPGLK